MVVLDIQNLFPKKFSLHELVPLPSDFQTVTPKALGVDEVHSEFEPRRECDVCERPLPLINNCTLDVFLHPYWQQEQMICETCVGANRGSCFACEQKLGIHESASRDRMCERCRVSAPVRTWREQYAMKQDVLSRITNALFLDDSTLHSLWAIPLKCKRSLGSIHNNNNQEICCPTSISSNSRTFGLCVIDTGLGEVSAIYVIEGLPRVVFCAVLLHEYFHALVYLRYRELMKNPRERRSLIQHLRSTSIEVEKKTEIEEAAAHLFSGELLRHVRAFSRHEKMLRGFWVYKTLPNKFIQDESGEVQEEACKSEACLQLWRNVANDIQKAMQATNLHEDQKLIRKSLWTEFLLELAILKYLA